MTAHSSDELRAIQSGGGQYTDEARDEARRELERRQPQASERADLERREEIRRPARVSHRIDDIILWPFRVVRSWWEAFAPEDAPPGVRRMFYAGVAAAVPSMAFVGFGVALYLAGETPAQAWKAVAGGGHVLVFGGGGLLLAWGIKARRPFARSLAALFVTGAAVSAIVAELRAGSISTQMFVMGAGALATVRYLFGNPESAEYFRRQHRESPAEPFAEAAGELPRVG